MKEREREAATDMESVRLGSEATGSLSRFVSSANVVKCSFARLTPSAKARIIGLREEGEKRSVIRRTVRKKDSKKPSIWLVDQILARFEKEGSEWDGVEDRTSGGPWYIRCRRGRRIVMILYYMVYIYI